MFPSPPFNSSRFYEYLNINFQDIPNYFNYGGDTCTSCAYANGYDDNLDDYHILTIAQRNLQLNAGLGYATWPPSGCGTNCNYTITFSGTPNNGEVTIPVYHNAPSNTYTNLVGNPYPSAIDLDKFFAINADLIDPVAFIWGRTLLNPDDTPNQGNPGPYPLSYSQDSYIIYNPTMMVVPFQNSPFNIEGVLASCQSFFVQTTSSLGDLVFNNSIRTKLPNNTFAKQSSITVGDKLWLNISNINEEKISQIGIAFNENASDNYSSKEDVKTFRNNKTTFYSIVDNSDLIINVQSLFNTSKIVPLGITTSKEVGSSLNINIDKKQGVFSNQKIFIHDKLNNTYYDISKEGFNFKVSNSIMDDRFILVFDKNKIENSSNVNSQINITNENHNLTIRSENNLKIKSIEVYDIYNFSINGTQLLKLQEINADKDSFTINEKYKLLLIITTLENGTVIYKKVTN